MCPLKKQSQDDAMWLVKKPSKLLDMTEEDHSSDEPPSTSTPKTIGKGAPDCEIELYPYFARLNVSSLQFQPLALSPGSTSPTITGGSISLSSYIPDMLQGMHLQVAPRAQGFLGSGRLWHTFETRMWKFADYDMWMLSQAQADEGSLQSTPPSLYRSPPKLPKRISDIGTVHPSDGPPSPTLESSVETVIKICCPSLHFDHIGHGEYATTAAKETAVLREMSIYSNQLKALQGKVVPICYGMLRAQVELSESWNGGIGIRGIDKANQDNDKEPIYIYGMVMQRLCDELPGNDFFASTQIQVMQLYDTLHEHNICHMDIHARHDMQARCKCHYGRYMLIDFEGAKTDCSNLDKKRETLKVFEMLLLLPLPEHELTEAEKKEVDDIEKNKVGHMETNDIDETEDDHMEKNGVANTEKNEGDDMEMNEVENMEE